MLFNVTARQVEGVGHLVFNGIDMSACMPFDVLDDLSGILFQMTSVFDECFASAADGVVGHKVLLGGSVLVEMKNQGFQLLVLWKPKTAERY
jgi:hypothetical protein